MQKREYVGADIEKNGPEYDDQTAYGKIMEVGSKPCVSWCNAKLSPKFVERPLSSGTQIIDYRHICQDAFIRIYTYARAVGIYLSSLIQDDVKR